MPLRVGQINYANCVPLFRALHHIPGVERHHFISGVPAVLNGMLSSGAIDLCISSSIIYGADPSRYWLIPDISISAKDRVRSVLLFSQLPIENLQGCRIGLTAESDTSVALLRIILGIFMGFENSFHRTELDLQQAFSSYSALLLIGDTAMRESMKDCGCHVYDLGELWHAHTGLPFVFALWIVNRQAISGRETELRQFSRDLSEAKRVAGRKIAEYASNTEGYDWFGRSELLSYWHDNISYDFGEKEQNGVLTFFRYASSIGIIKNIPDLFFLPEHEIPEATANHA